MNILFMNEAQFHHDSIISTRNSHSWLHDNPYEVIQSYFKHGFSVKVWRGTVGNHLCGPHFIERHLTAASYKFFWRMNYNFM